MRKLIAARADARYLLSSLDSEPSDALHTESAPWSPSGQGRDRRSFLRAVAASSLAAALIGVGGRPQRAAAQDPPTPEEMADRFKQWIISPNGPDGEVLPKSSFDVH